MTDHLGEIEPKAGSYDIENGKAGEGASKEQREDVAVSPEKETLTCEICYDTIEIVKGALAQDQNIFKLQACSHTFCRECFQETFHSLILEQNRHDDLQCP